MTIIFNALSGTIAAQAALNATSQNIANVMTEGYTRQGVLLASVQPLQAGSVSAGSGVAVSSLLRYSDSYKNLQMWQAASELGQYKAGQNYLTQLEQVMGDDASNLNSGLDTFFGALNAASVDPTSNPLRQQVISAADALAQRFNSLNQVLSNQLAAVQKQRSAVVSQINGLSSDIASLNKEIAATQATGVNASGLIDARDQKIDKLAALVGIQVVEQPDGSSSVSLRNGQPLVVAGIAAQMNLVGASQELELSFANTAFKVRDDDLRGELGGLNAFQRTALEPMQLSILDMAEGLSDEVNAVLAAGYDLDGNSPGKPLFEFTSTSTTSMLKVTDGLLAKELAFSASATEQGDSTQLHALIGLEALALNINALGTVRLGDAMTQLVGKLGVASQQNLAARGTAQTVRDQSEESWKSTSGVNQDEEAINLIRYQQMYQSNMKVIAVANELFDSTLAMM